MFRLVIVEVSCDSTHDALSVIAGSRSNARPHRGRDAVVAVRRVSLFIKGVDA